ncbi:hypothetical protein [Nocardia mexicana]|uniref:Uncharacterized protein n=1 Tax=Nocardia mexicana TaxID=279262 RepID=A0A370H2V7_9NOCA|nr:hypothetical protein [Nocardia mexicana]RDI50550.1 hypothetical protein DFR68_10526 [Nocardia mexicana]
MAETESADKAEDRAGPFAGLAVVAPIIGQFVAPATLLAGLLFYWGFFHARGFCKYFGVDSSVLGLSTTDYVMRSADGLFVPLALCGATALGLLWLWAVLPSRIRGASWPRWMLAILTVVGFLLMLNGLSRPQFETPLNRSLGVAPICLIIGVLLLWAVVLERRKQNSDDAEDSSARTSTPLEWGLILLLVGGAFFWGATDYSMAVGRGRADDIARLTLRTDPGVTIYSEKNLALGVRGVTTVRCAEPDAAYRFRYDGLVLIMTTTDNLVLLPRTWTPRDGAAIVLPRTGPGATRYEYAWQRGAAPTC